MRSPWSVGIIMIAFAGIGISNLGQAHAPLTVAQWIVCGALLVAGALMFIGKPFTTWIALAAALLLTASGFAAMKRPDLGMPSVPPVLAIVIGFYLMLRTLIAKKPSKPKSGSFAPPTDEVP